MRQTRLHPEQQLQRQQQPRRPQQQQRQQQQQQQQQHRHHQLDMSRRDNMERIFIATGRRQGGLGGDGQPWQGDGEWRGDGRWQAETRPLSRFALEEGWAPEPAAAPAPPAGPPQHLITYRQPPFFITFISIFELVTFLYYALRSDEPLTLLGPVPFQSKLIYNPYRRYEVWRFLTYMFIHAGYWHIAFNLLIQLAVGIPLELAHKFEPVFIIYMGGILAGALGNSLADPNTYLAGASSGCYALIAAHLANLIINWSEIKGACCRLFTLLVFSVWDLGTAVYERHFRLGFVPGRTSYGGHLSGALSGLLLGLVFLRNARVLDWEVTVKKWAAGIYLVLVIFAIHFNVANPDYFPLPDKRDLVWTANPFSFEREQ